MEGFFSGVQFYLSVFGACLLVILPGEILQRQTLKKKEHLYLLVLQMSIHGIQFPPKCGKTRENFE